MIKRISAIEIDTWAKADPRRAQEILPSLMIRLILATSNKIGDFNFPIEKGIQYSGYDGVLNSNESTKFFPIGKSVWEFGTDNDALNKFRTDVEKRYKNPLGVVIKETTFIFATLKIWNHRISIEELINESKEKFNWNDIRIIDASKIALWLENCPGVSIWMCEKIGKFIKGMLSIEKYWNENCLTTKPILIDEFFLYGRNVQSDILSNWLKNREELGYRILIAESSLEATLFIIATIRNLSVSNENNIMLDLGSKVIIVTSFETWNEIISADDFTNYIIFIPVFNYSDDIRCPKGISAILPISKYSPNFKNTDNIEKIEIPISTKNKLTKSFEILGYSTSEAYNIVNKSKRNFLAFYRMITTLPSRKQPKWTIKDNLQELIPALLIGGWNDKYTGDKEIIEKISGMDYDEYIKKLSKWMLIEDAPLFSRLGNYQIVSIQDCWSFLFDKLAPSDINNLENYAREVFCENDFELSENQQFMASIYGKKHKFSTSIQHGIAITLIMLSQMDSIDNSFGVISTNNFVYSLVRDILDEINSVEQLSTVVTSLSLLTEASPEAVLEKLEREIDKENTNLWKLFVPSKIFFMGNNYYTHILWALEILVWNSNLVVRAILVLAKICEKNIEYTTMNSPQNTLYGIFCPWNPQNVLSKGERIELLKKIYEIYPITGQNLIENLLPKKGSICGQIQRPRWAAWDEKECSVVTYNEYRETINEIIELSLTKLSNNIKQWKNIFKNIDIYQHKFEEIREKCLQYLELFSDEDTIMITDCLRRQIHKFRKFKDADWSISEENISKWESLFNEIEPNTIKRYSYLFTWHPNLLNPVPYEENSEKYNYEVEEKLIFNARSQAIDEMIDKYGIDRIISFSSSLESIEDLSTILSEKIFNNSFEINTLIKIKKQNYKLYSLIIHVLTIENSLEIIVSIIMKDRSLSEEEKADILCHVPMSKELLSIIETSFSKTVSDYFWNNIEFYKLYTHNIGIIDFCIMKLLEYNRPFSIVKIIAHSDYRNTEIIILLLKQLLLLKEDKEVNGLCFLSVNQYDIKKLFDKLYMNQNIDNSVVARLEVAYFPYFVHDRKPDCLVKYLHANPKEFALLISKCYKSDDPSNKIIFDSEEYRVQSKTAFDSLSLFKSIPGCNKDILSSKIFNSWVNEAYEYANFLEFKKAFELCLGKLISYSPTGSDGIFPHEIIREFLEKNESSFLVESFIIGKRNQRGMYALSAGLYEKKIANGYYEDSKKIRVSYPKTSAILTLIGDSYKLDSRYEQEQELLDFKY